MVQCGVAAFASVSLSLDEMAVIRKAPEANLGLPLAPSMARHCDEQTIAVLSAVSEAVRKLGTPPSEFESWGIVASSRYLGRSFFSQSLEKFDRDGPWNTSIQVVPNRSLHSPSSTVSLLLGCHGPNVGVGGGVDGEGQALLTALSLLNDDTLPGVWLLLSGWSPELNVDAAGQPTTDARCQALAVAMRPSTEVPDGLHLRVVPDFESSDEADKSSSPRSSNWLSLLTAMLHRQPQKLNVIAPLCDGLRAELVWDNSQSIALSASPAALRNAG